MANIQDYFKWLAGQSTYDTQSILIGKGIGEKTNMRACLRIDIKDSADRREIVRILQDNGYECKLVNDTATLDKGKKQYVYLEIENKYYGE